MFFRKSHKPKISEETLVRIGSIEIEPGKCLATSEELIREQKLWDEKNQFFSVDFTQSPYWILTENGEVVALSDWNHVEKEISKKP